MKSLTIRKKWIDALRAMAMIFVVFGHQAQWCDSFFLYTTPIKIPLFFVISGYLFNDRNGDQKFFYKGWFLKLVFPFFCLVTIPSLVFSFYNGFGTLFDSWRKMISGESYWFITCLIIAEVIHFYIRKISRNPFWIAVACLLCATIGFVLCNHNLGDYAKINTALISQSYLLLGYLYRSNEDKFDSIGVWIIFGCLFVYFFLCYMSPFLFHNIFFDCNRNQYYSIPYCFLLILLGCGSCFLVAKRVHEFPDWLTYIGQNTYILYLWAGYSLLLFVLLAKLGITIPKNNLAISLIQTVWVAVACMGAAYIINRFFPAIVGKKKNS